MAAVDDLLSRLLGIDETVDLLAKPGLNQPVSEHLLRGVAVNGLVSVEEFLRRRIDEWVHALSMSRIPPSRLPGGTKAFEDRMVSALPRSLRDSDMARRPSLLDEVGKSLTSLSGGVLVPHYLAFSWIGSNLQASDIEAMVSMASGVDPTKAWSELTRIWRAVDKHFPGNVSLKNVFEEVARLRHDAAHDAKPPISLPSMSTLTRNIRLVCLCVDVAVSDGLANMRAGVVKPSQRTLPIRRIVQDGSRWPEYAPSSQRRAVKRHASLGEARQEALARAQSGRELLLVVTSVEDILDWTYPLG
jgi:hypothetical protein